MVLQPRQTDHLERTEALIEQQETNSSDLASLTHFEGEKSNWPDEHSIKEKK